MHWVLIFISLYGGMSSQEFVTEDACKQAKQFVLNANISQKAECFPLH